MATMATIRTLFIHCTVTFLHLMRRLTREKASLACLHDYVIKLIVWLNSKSKVNSFLDRT